MLNGPFRGARSIDSRGDGSPARKRARSRYHPILAAGQEEEIVAMRAHPRPDPKLRVTVARRGVDVVHPVPEQQFKGTIRVALAHVLERRRAEYGHGA